MNTLTMQVISNLLQILVLDMLVLITNVMILLRINAAYVFVSVILMLFMLWFRENVIGIVTGGVDLLAAIIIGWSMGTMSLQLAVALGFSLTIYHHLIYHELHLMFIRAKLYLLDLGMLRQNGMFDFLIMNNDEAENDIEDEFDDGLDDILNDTISNEDEHEVNSNGND